MNIVISSELLNSKAWNDLKMLDKALYLEILNHSMIMTKTIAEQMMNLRTYWKCIDNLLSHGIIELEVNKLGERRVFKKSYKWKRFGTSEFIEPDKRCLKPISEKQRQAIVNSLNKTNRCSVKQARKGYVYIIKNDLGQIKIGCTVNIHKRLKDLAKIYGELTTVKIIETDNMYLKERELHKKFDKKRLPNCEWFNLTIEETLAL